MPPVGFEPTISASDRPQTYALDRARLLGPANSKSRRGFLANKIRLFEVQGMLLVFSVIKLL